MFPRALAWFAATCIGYAAAHVIVIYFVCNLVLGTVGLAAAAKLDSALGGQQTLILVVTAMALVVMFGGEVQNEVRTPRCRAAVGVGAALFAASFAARALL